MHIRDSGGIFGGERVILTLGKNIDRDKFNFYLLCMNRRNGKSEPLVSRARQLGIITLPIDVKGRLDFSAIVNIRRLLRKYNIDIFHSHDFKSDFYGLVASVGRPIKRVLTCHGSTRDSLLKRIYLLFTERLIYHFFDMIIAVSESLGKELILKNLNPNKIKVVQNGLDSGLLGNDAKETNLEESLCFPEERKVFAVIGRLYPDKGHRFFLEAFSKVSRNHPHITGLIVGDGPTRDVIVRQVRELNLEKSVFLCGIRSNMKAVYDSIDFLVIPSLTEGLPYVLLEAIASKIPIVATSVGDIPLLLKDEVTGYIVPPGDVDALEKRMTDLLKYPQKAKQLAEKGHSLVAETYSAQMMVMTTEKHYSSLFN